MFHDSKKKYRVALSFPGAKRPYVADVARHLASIFGESRVLYDEYHTAEFSRADLAFYLPKLYREQSDLIVAFHCAEFVASEWCGLNGPPRMT